MKKVYNISHRIIFHRNMIQTNMYYTIHIKINYERVCENYNIFLGRVTNCGQKPSAVMCKNMGRV